MYEAMEIFGEGIQDFDFMKLHADEDGEVGRRLVGWLTSLSMDWFVGLLVDGSLVSWFVGSLVGGDWFMVD